MNTSTCLCCWLMFLCIVNLYTASTLYPLTSSLSVLAKIGKICISCSKQICMYPDTVHFVCSILCPDTVHFVCSILYPDTVHFVCSILCPDTVHFVCSILCPDTVHFVCSILCPDTVHFVCSIFSASVNVLLLFYCN